jgi:hypothetical protein
MRAVRLSLHIPQSSETESQLDGSGIDYDGYDDRRKRYVLRLGPQDVAMHKDLLRDLIRLVYKESQNLDALPAGNEA